MGSYLINPFGGDEYEISHPLSACLRPTLSTFAKADWNRPPPWQGNRR
jgi:hypothetical protein